MGACASQLPTAVVVGDKLSESSIDSPTTVPMANHTDPNIVRILNNLLKEEVEFNGEGEKQCFLSLFEFKNRLKNHFGNEYVKSMVNIPEIRRLRL